MTDGDGRRAEVRRTTRETDVLVRLALDGTGDARVSTGVGFYDHLLRSLATHALLDLTIEATGDLEVDEHHVVGDVAIGLGRALTDALGERRGIRRFANASVPMDEALATVALDLSGRSYAVLDLAFGGERIGALSTQLVPHALEAFASAAGLTLHARAAGRVDHHVAEATFKALAVCLHRAVEIDERRVGVPSAKGVLETEAAR